MCPGFGIGFSFASFMRFVFAALLLSSTREAPSSISSAVEVGFLCAPPLCSDLAPVMNGLSYV